MGGAEMPESGPFDLTPHQISLLDKIVTAGFKPLALERFARYIAVEKEGFIALLDPAGGKLNVFGQIGYRIDEGIGMLVERAGKQVFLWHGKSVEATPALLAAYNKFRAELEALLENMQERFANRP